MAVVPIDDLDDPRLADYPHLREPSRPRAGSSASAASSRWRGWLSLEALLGVALRLRSVLVAAAARRAAPRGSVPADARSTRCPRDCDRGGDRRRTSTAGCWPWPSGRRRARWPRSSPTADGSSCSRPSTTTRTSARCSATRPPSASTRSCSTPPPPTRSTGAPRACRSGTCCGCRSRGSSDGGWPARSTSCAAAGLTTRRPHPGAGRRAARHGGRPGPPSAWPSSSGPRARGSPTPRWPRPTAASGSPWHRASTRSTWPPRPPSPSRPLHERQG